MNGGWKWIQWQTQEETLLDHVDTKPAMFSGETGEQATGSVDSWTCGKDNNKSFFCGFCRPENTGVQALVIGFIRVIVSLLWGMVQVWVRVLDYCLVSSLHVYIYIYPVAWTCIPKLHPRAWMLSQYRNTTDYLHRLSIKISGSGKIDPK